MRRYASAELTASAARLHRRDLLLGAGVVAGGLAGGHGVLAQGRGVMNLSFWTFENPQQRPWIHKRVRMFTERNPNVRVDFQYFPFGDLGQKLSVGFATGTAPDGFVSQDWFMPTWMSRNLLAPMDVRRLGYENHQAFVNDFPPAFVEGATQGGQVYGFPLWFYGFCNYLNTRHFQEVGLDAEKDWPQDWEQLGEVARRLTVREGDRFARQGFKFAMHAAQWTMIHLNPIVHQCGARWFDDSGRCVVNSEAGVRAMTIRASIARHYAAEDPADTIATNPLPMMDWLRERCSMFFNHPIPPAAIQSQNQRMYEERYYRPVQYPGVQRGRGYSTTYGFNLVVNARASRERQEMLQEMYRFMMSDPADAWADAAPFPLGRKSGWVDNPAVQAFPHVGEIIRARDEGVMLPRTTVFNELADQVHRGVQRILLNRADIKQTLDQVAAAVDRASDTQRRG